MYTLLLFKHYIFTGPFVNNLFPWQTVCTVYLYRCVSETKGLQSKSLKPCFSYMLMLECSDVHNDQIVPRLSRVGLEGKSICPSRLAAGASRGNQSSKPLVHWASLVWRREESSKPSQKQQRKPIDGSGSWRGANATQTQVVVCLYLKHPMTPGHTMLCSGALKRWIFTVLEISGRKILDNCQPWIGRWLLERQWTVHKDDHQGGMGWKPKLHPLSEEDQTKVQIDSFSGLEPPSGYSPKAHARRWPTSCPTMATLTPQYRREAFLESRDV